MRHHPIANRADGPTLRDYTLQSTWSNCLTGDGAFQASLLACSSTNENTTAGMPRRLNEIPYYEPDRRTH